MRINIIIICSLSFETRGERSIFFIFFIIGPAVRSPALHFKLPSTFGSEKWPSFGFFLGGGGGREEGSYCIFCTDTYNLFRFFFSKLLIYSDSMQKIDSIFLHFAQTTFSN